MFIDNKDVVKDQGLAAGLRRANNLPNKLSDKGCVIHNAIDYKRFYNTSKKQLKSSAVKFINVGSLVNKKNQQFLIDVMIELKKRNVEFELNLLGDGPNRELITEKIKSNNSFILNLLY